MKQVTYGGTFLALVFLFLYGIYALFLAPGPSCTNGSRDRGEEGVDCGGVCARVCVPDDLRPLTKDPVEKFSPVADRLTLFAVVRNPNAAYAARRFEYRFDLYGAADGAYLRSVSGVSFAYGGEIKYITEFLQDTDPRSVGRVELVLGEPVWDSAAVFSKPQLAVQDRVIDATASGISISGKIVHRDTLDLPRVTILVLLNGAISGRPLGVTQTVLDQFVAGSTRSFSLFHPPIPGFNSSRVEFVIIPERP